MPLNVFSTEFKHHIQKICGIWKQSEFFFCVSVSVLYVGGVCDLPQE